MEFKINKYYIDINSISNNSPYLKEVSKEEFEKVRNFLGGYEKFSPDLDGSCNGNIILYVESWKIKDWILDKLINEIMKGGD